RQHFGRAAREAEMRRDGYPAYTTSTGWLGYPDEKVRRLCREAMAQGWTAFKMKVGQNLDDNLRRAALMRSEIGPDRRLMMDANQCWDVGEAIEQMAALKRFDPYWIEEPTSPDDVLGHAAVDHLHEHFVDPCIVRNARYAAPARPGYSITIKPESLDAYEFPAGRVWREPATAVIA